MDDPHAAMLTALRSTPRAGASLGRYEHRDDALVGLVAVVVAERLVQLALELRDRYEQVTPGYHMNKKHWNTVEIEGGIPDLELRKMIDHSYDLVAKGLPKPRAKVAPRSRRNLTAARRGRR